MYSLMKINDKSIWLEFLIIDSIIIDYYMKIGCEFEERK